MQPAIAEADIFPGLSMLFPMNVSAMRRTIRSGSISSEASGGFIRMGFLPRNKFSESLEKRVRMAAKRVTRTLDALVEPGGAAFCPKGAGEADRRVWRG